MSHRSGCLHTSVWRPTHFGLETYPSHFGLAAYLAEHLGLAAYHTPVWLPTCLPHFGLEAYTLQSGRLPSGTLRSAAYPIDR
eukprot:4292074-Amphidinium_carterae.1